MKLKDRIWWGRYNLFVLLSIMIVAMSVISAVAATTNYLEAIKFALFQIVGLLLPGLAILKLFPIKDITREEQLILAYVDGYILSMIMYLMIMFFNLDQYVVLLYGGISVISISIIIIKGKDENEEFINHKLDFMPWLFLVVLLFVSWLIFSMHWSVSTYTTEFDNDLLFWIGDIISLDKKFLPIDFRSLQPERKYHYGGAMQLAMICKVTKISAFNMAVHYSYIQSMILLVFSAFCVGRRILKNRKVVGFVLFLLFFSTGIENRSFVTYVWHIFIQPMSFNIALSLELIILLLLIMQIDLKEVNYSILCRMVLGLLTCTITKGPSGAIALCVIGVVCAFWIFGRREIKKAILYGSLSVVAFGGIYLFLSDINSAYVIKDTIAYESVEVQAVYEERVDSKNIEEEQSVQEMETALESVEGEPVAYDNEMVLENSDDIKRVNDGGILLEKVEIKIISLLRYMAYVLYINPWIFVPGGIYIIYSIFKKKMELICWICTFVLLIGTILGYVLNYVGKSQMYFALAVYPFAALLTGLALCEIIHSQNILLRVSINTKRFLVIGGCCFILICSGIGAYRNYLEQAMYVGMANLCQESYQEVMKDSKYDKMAYGEYEAYEWIRLNTDKNAIFLSDRMLEDNRESRVPGVFCERYIYRFQKEEINNARSCFAGDEESILDYADKGIRYIIQNKGISPDFRGIENIVVKLYENPYIAVYEMHESDKWRNF